MVDNDNVLFVRDNGDASGNHEDIWDDSALITAYDKAIKLARDEVAKRISMETDSSRGKANKSQNSKQYNKQQRQFHKKWTVGSPCRAIYSVDGEEYEAIISKIFDNDCGTCIVKFVGYGNTEKVELSSLRESEGLEAQIAHQKDAEAVKQSEDSYPQAAETSYPQYSHENTRQNGERMDYESEVPRHLKYAPGPSLHSFGAAPPAPPIPPQLMAKLPENDADALSSMLMSWYISGFHTGFYHGMKQAETNANRRKK